jgi:nucleotide-binding universal stress UspA family protein
MTTGPIILAIDFSACSAAAVPVAQSLARSCQAMLLVVHVLPGEPTARLGAYYASLSDPNVTAAARQLVESAPATADLACDHRILTGDPAEEIVRLARQESARMIVIGTHGRTGAKKLLMGSVAEHVVRNSPCPVVVCRDPNDVSGPQET